MDHRDRTQILVAIGVFLLLIGLAAALLGPLEMYCFYLFSEGGRFHYEGFGFPVLEAMHCGCPVICSDRASLPEVAGDAAILLDPDDIDAWSHSIESLLTDTAMQNKMVEKGYQQASSFTWNKTARETVRIYDSI